MEGMFQPLISIASFSSPDCMGVPAGGNQCSDQATGPVPPAGSPCRGRELVNGNSFRQRSK